MAAPVFFHGKQIVVRRDVEPAGALMRLANTAKPVFVFWRDSPSAPRNSEVRGEFWDVGRLERTDSRFSNVNFQPILDAASNGQWPARDQVFMILSASTVESPLPDGSEAAGARARAGSVHRQRRDGHRALPRRQPVRRSAAGRGDEGPLGLRAAVGRRRDLGERRPSARARASISTSTRASTPAAGSRSPARCAATARCRGSRRPRSPRPPRRRETVVEVALPPPPAAACPRSSSARRPPDETDADRAAPDPDPVFARHGRQDVHATGSGSPTPAPRPTGAPATPPPFTVRYIDGNRALEIKLVGAARSLPHGEGRSARRASSATSTTSRSRRTRSRSRRAGDAAASSSTVSSQEISETQAVQELLVRRYDPWPPSAHGPPEPSCDWHRSSRSAARRNRRLHRLDDPRRRTRR